ncbi:MAG: selenide, water dikinase SelD [Synergistaceae bacterium]|nr:selenide, water dikinase SelD [Synergistaceae bacterium]
MKNERSIMANCTSGGCGAKIGAGELSALLRALPDFSDERLLVGFDSSDDAAVYQVDERTAIISTVDFFSPMVENPRTFGRIAAANAMSDVWAMGGKVLFALNLVCFPEEMDKSILGEMLSGGAEKIMEAGAVIAGGHSIYDKEPKYGLAVTGIAPGGSFIRNDSPSVGHRLILTKPLGVGIVMAALRGEIADETSVAAAVASMERLNKAASEKMTAGYNVSACTDITGFGLLSHILEMTADRVSVRLFCDNLPVIPQAVSYAEEYLLTAAGQRNRNHVSERGVSVAKLPFATQELLFDPQTSGGLLISVDSDEAESLLLAIQDGDPCASIVGEVVPKVDAPVDFA